MTQNPHTTRIAADASGAPGVDLTQRMDEVELALEVLVDAETKDDWLRPNDRNDWCFHDRMKEVKANLQHIRELCRDGEAYRVERQRRARPDDGLRTKAEAAAKLGISIRTLDGHIASGALRYVPMGHGKKRLRRKLAVADLDQFIADQTRKDVPTCPPTRTRVRRTGNLTSGGEVIAFTGVPKPGPGGKQKL